MPPLSLFTAYGVELEYMIVDKTTLNVRPIADELIHAVCGSYESEIEQGAISWSNELALHVIELKTNGPAKSLVPLAKQFHEQVCKINDILSGMNARLMPAAMHPWMNPHEELKLWPHEHNAVYEAFNRIFDCRGHGWANLQSVHLNLPFSGDEQFGRLHAAVRLLLPLLPALAASSPIMDGQATGLLDNRLEVYRTNARTMKSVTGRVIPEPAYTQAEYDRQIFQPMFADIAPLDPDGVLQDEFLNARGAIARFGRGTIEIRVLDIQESPHADLAIVETIVEVLKRIVAEKWTSWDEQQRVSIDTLEPILLKSIREGDSAIVDDADYLGHLGLDHIVGGTTGDVWKFLVDTISSEDADFANRHGKTLSVILDRGPLSRRLLERVGGDTTPPHLHTVYGQLCDSLATGSLLE